MRSLERTLGKESYPVLETFVEDIVSASSIIVRGEGEAESYSALLRESIETFYPEK